MENTIRNEQASSQLEVARLQEHLSLLESYHTSDPAFEPLLAQVQNHLEHVGYDFKIAGDSEDYPYALSHNGAYPVEPTAQAIKRAKRLINLLNDTEVPTIDIAVDVHYGRLAEAVQNDVAQEILNDPVGAYKDFTERRREFGAEAPFPELGWTLKGLLSDMLTKTEVNDACNASPLLQKLRASIVAEIQPKVIENKFGYTSTLWLIEDAISFFDLVVRTNEPSSPPTYHSKYFEYNWYSLAADNEATILPTMANFTGLDLLKVRSVPVGFIGVHTSTLRVDGFQQTPYEFFYHDVDHTRRMHAETKAAIEREGVSPEKFAEDATNLLTEVLLPAVDAEGLEDGPERDRRIAMWLILFEILHEDAYDPTRDTIADAILRAPLERTPFERLVNGTTVEYFMGPRATTLAHVFRKLAHTFYDLPEDRHSSLGSDFVRTRTAISEGAANLYRLVSDDPIEDEALLNTCRDLVSTDEGFTDAFIGNIAHDIKRRGTGRSALKLGISRPLGVAAAVRKARSFRPRVHSLFGYSALEYEDPELLEKSVEADLRAFNNEETAIAIGATPYGIGRLYPVIKDLGFYSLGIVASTAIGRNEECAEDVDSIVVIKDNGWGGFRYSQQANGLLSPTTRVFLGASDSIAAYGGGDITAVTLEEAKRRGKPVSFKPFDMNHRIADMLRAQKGDTSPADYQGPAHLKWTAL